MTDRGLPHLQEAVFPMRTQSTQFTHLVFARTLQVVPLMAFLAATTLARAADTFDILTKQSDTPTSTVWHIETPNVKQKQTDYPQITFVPGDTVSIDAGGCVQTGGSGLTWKRYVNPGGPNSDHLYHGLISIPGVTNGLVRIQDFGLDNVHQIPATLPAGVSRADLYLRLGYEDDGYSDNGYTKHDNGTGDQCKNSVDAFVIVSIGHAGAAPVSASAFVGISPNLFRCQAGWAFHNFDTARLSLASFTDAFDFSILDYLDPATGIIFLATRDNLASNGNCMGMSFLALVGEDQFVVDDIDEDFWDNYKDWTVPSPKVAKDINTAHWAQLSVAFLHSYLANVGKSPAENAALIEQDLSKQNYNYGLISIAHGTDGHVIVPLKVTHSGSEILIDVYDPNRQCLSVPDTATHPQLIINGDKRSFVMGDGSTWSGSTLNDGLAYIPYTSSSGWRSFAANFTGIIEVIFGGNTQIQQVTDAQGRKLYIDGTQTIDSSPTGLGRSLLRLPALHQSSGPRPRVSGSKYSTVSSAQPPAAFAQASANLEAEYGADYGSSSSIFLTTDTTLANLSFSIGAADTTKPMRAMVHAGNQFFEVKIAPSQGSRVALVLPKLSALAAQGVTIQNVDGKPLSATVALGSNLQGVVTVQRTAPLSITGSVQAKAAQSDLVPSSEDTLPPTTITEQNLTVAGEQLKPVRPLSVLRVPKVQ
jgi:hypothetical protein